MRQLVLVTVVATLSGATAVVACGKDDVGDGRPANPNFEHPDAGGTSASSGSAGVTPKGVSATATELCNAIYSPFADAFANCCSAADKDTAIWKLVGGRFPDLRNECIASLDPSIQSGHLFVDGTKLAACHDETVAETACVKLTDPFLANRPLTACSQLWKGSQALGAPCLRPMECVAGTTCVGYGTGTPGTCRATPRVGESCGQAPSDAGVVFTLNFNRDNLACADGSTCVGGTCRVGLPDGSACTSNAECASNCHLGKCSASGPTGAGTTCHNDGDCTPDLYCLPPDGGGDGSCVTRKIAGAACFASSSFDTGGCVGRCDSVTSMCASYCGSK